MATVDDYDSSDDNDSEDDPGAASAASSGSANSTNQADPSAQKDAPYVPWSAFTSANSAVDSAQANKLTNQVSSDAASASGAIKSASDADTNAIDSNYGNGNTAKTTGAGDTAVAAPASVQKDATEKVVNPNPPQAVQPTGETQLPPQQQQLKLPQTAPAGQTVDAAPVQATTTLAGADAAANPAPAPAHTWAGFTNGPPQAQPTAVAKSTAVNPALQQAAIRSEALNAQGLGANPGGSANLEASMSPDAWTKLTGQVQNAQSEANTLGQGESGVQALLQANTGAPTDTAFDAALLNSSNGQQFRGVSQQYGNNALNNQLTAADQNAQNLWTQFTANQKAALAAQNQPVTGTAVPLQEHPSFIPTVGPDATGTNPISSIGGSNGTSIGASGQPLDALGLDEGLAPPQESDWDKVGRWMESGQNANYDINGPPNFSTSVPPSGGGPGGVLPDGQVWFPLMNVDAQGNPLPSAYGGFGSKGIAWSDFWGGAPGAPGNGFPWNPDSLGLTGQQWYAIGSMTPQQRASWWTQYGAGISAGYKGDPNSANINYPPNPLDD